MSKIIAVCGLVCNDCIAYIATQKNDDKMREKVVEAWSTEKERLKLEDVDCDGCAVGKRLYKFCSVCEVRKCGLQKASKTALTATSIDAKNLKNSGRAFEPFLGKKQERI